MERTNVMLDAVVVSEPNFPQASRKVSYVNDSGMTLTIHTPCGETLKLPSREASCARMVLSVYVTYTLSSTVGINGIQERNPDQSVVIEKVNGSGTVTLKYELRDFTDIKDGKIVILDPLKLGVTLGESLKNEYPDQEDDIDKSSPMLCFTVKTQRGYFSHNGSLLPFRGGGGNGGVVITLLCGGYRANLGEYRSTEHTLPFIITDNKVDAERLKALKEKEIYDTINLVQLSHDGERTEAYKQINKARGLIIDKIENEKDLEYKLAAAEQKIYYEGRSYQRKDTSESFKYLPALMSGIGVVVGLML